MTPVQPPIRDVVIAGGSHAGLALALALARGLDGALRVSVIERLQLAPAADVSTDPRAFAISAASRSLLQAIGVWEALCPHAEPVLALDITDSSLDDAVRPVLLSYDNLKGGKPQSFIVEAWRLRAALLQAARAEASVELLDGRLSTGLRASRDSIEVVLADGSGIRARLAVAADGARSPLREAAGIATLASSYDQLGIVATVAHEQPHCGRAVQHFLPGGPFAMLPLPGGHSSCITWSEGAATGARIMAMDDSAFLAEAQRRAAYRLGELSLLGSRASWPLELRLARELTAPRLALAGDAARSVHPIAGQGVNLGFRDVAALAEAVADGVRLGLEPGDATILTRYARWRRFDGTQSAAVFGALNAMFSNDRAVLRGIRDVGLGLVDRLPGLKSLAVSEAAGATGTVPRLMRGARL